MTDKKSQSAKSATRRTLLLAAAAAATLPLRDAFASGKPGAAAALRALEREAAGRLGVFAFDTARIGTAVAYRADERFAICSTFKVLLAGAVLRRSASEPGLLTTRVPFSAADLVANSPMTKPHAGDSMTVAQLCAAALQYSDNTAANLLMKRVGGPAGVTAFARSIGDTTTRLDRWETALNSAIPGDLRDTGTPRAMAQNLQRLTLGDALAAPERDQLLRWMRGNTTGSERIRAGVPAFWTLADKTGTGDYGTTNDIAVLEAPGRAPCVIALYFTQRTADARARSDVLASAARIAADALGLMGT